MPRDIETFGFSVSRPIGSWNRSLDVDYPAVFSALAKATTYYLSGSTGSGLASTVDALFAFKVSGREPGPAELAWDLIRRALARAMSNLTADALKAHGKDDIPHSAKELVGRLDSALDDVEIWIDSDFFDRPAALPCIEAVKPAFNDWLAECGIEDADIRMIQDRLGAYVTFALHIVWAEDPHRFASIETALSGAQTPFGKADTRERGWLKNAAHLQKAINEPVFDEAFGLAQIYVPLRAYWTLTEKRLESASIDDRGSKARKPTVIDLETELREWFVGGRKDDAIRIICGGPGSGKTSFAKMLAADLSTDARYRVLFVPLHEIEYEGDFRLSLVQHLRRVELLEFDPLDPADDDRRLILFLDGLDELAMQGHAGQTAAGEFIQHLAMEIKALNKELLRVQVILGGREIVVEAHENFFRGERQVLHMLPYFVENTEDRNDPSARRRFDDPHDLLSVDQRDIWWQRYSKATSKAFDALPKELKIDSLEEVTGQPLLNYLLALSLQSGQVKFDDDFNLNDLYADLVNEIWRRRWGDQRRLPEVEHLSRDQFVRIMEEIGLAAWHAGQRGIPASKIRKLCESAGLMQQLASFEQGAEVGATSLLAAFYFRHRPNKDGEERAFEFTHKSFGEYLVARRLVRAISTTHRLRARYEGLDPEYDREEGIDKRGALVRWAETTGHNPLEANTFAFLKRQVQLEHRDEEIDVHQVAAWQKTFADLISDIQIREMPMERASDLNTFGRQVANARNAEESLLAAHAACGFVTAKSSPIQWPTVRSFKDLVRRLGRDRAQIIGRSLAWLGADGQDLFWTDLRDADLTGASLSGALLQGANLYQAKMRGADLRSALIDKANLAKANLRKANLVGARANRADLSEAELSGANLEKASFVGANLNGAFLVDCFNHRIPI